MEGDRRGQGGLRGQRDHPPVVPSRTECRRHVLRARPGVGVHAARALRSQDRHGDTLPGRDADGARRRRPESPRRHHAGAGKHAGARAPGLLREDARRSVLHAVRRQPVQAPAGCLVQLDGVLRRRQGIGRREQHRLARREPQGLRLRLRADRRRVRPWAGRGALLDRELGQDEVPARAEVAGRLHQVEGAAPGPLAGAERLRGRRRGAPGLVPAQREGRDHPRLPDAVARLDAPGRPGIPEDALRHAGERLGVRVLQVRRRARAAAVRADRGSVPAPRPVDRSAGRVPEPDRPHPRGDRAEHVRRGLPGRARR